MWTGHEKCCKLVSYERADFQMEHVCSVTSVMSNSFWHYDCSPSGSSVHGILQARILEWVSDPGIKSASPALEVHSLPLSHQGSPSNGGIMEFIVEIGGRTWSEISWMSFHKLFLKRTKETWKSEKKVYVKSKVSKVWT